MEQIANVTKSFVYLSPLFHPMKKSRNIFSMSFMIVYPYKRHYHSDLSIWLSVDPMSDKYPSTSPYVYCANNPVRLVDPDGRDYEVVVDSKSEHPTITIRATFYCDSDSKKLLDKGLERWNSESGKYSYTTEDGTKYTIMFDLKSSDDPNSFKASSKTDNRNAEKRGAEFNAFQITDVSEYYIDGDRGVTLNGHVCYVKTDSPLRSTYHEIGHALGMGDFSGTENVMVSGGNGDAININNIYQILTTSGIKCSAELIEGSRQLTPPQFHWQINRE